MGAIIDRTQQFEANKTFTMGGVEYPPGYPVDVSNLPDHKVSQLLNQRFIRPAQPVTAPQLGAGTGTGTA